MPNSSSPDLRLGSQESSGSRCQHASAWHLRVQQRRICLSSNAAPGCSNDAFDAEMGVDAAKPESVVNLTGNRGGVLWAANAFLAAALAIFSRSLPVAVSSLWVLHPLAAEQLCGSVQRRSMQALSAQACIRQASPGCLRWIMGRVLAVIPGCQPAGGRAAAAAAGRGAGDGVHVPGAAVQVGSRVFLPGGIKA
jgi:hypothetical protein